MAFCIIFWSWKCRYMQLYKNWQYRPDRAGKFPSDLTRLDTKDLVRYSHKRSHKIMSELPKIILSHLISQNLPRSCQTTPP